MGHRWVCVPLFVYPFCSLSPNPLSDQSPNPLSDQSQLFGHRTIPGDKVLGWIDDYLHSIPDYLKREQSAGDETLKRLSGPLHPFTLWLSGLWRTEREPRENRERTKREHERFSCHTNGFLTPCSASGVEDMTNHTVLPCHNCSH